MKEIILRRARLVAGSPFIGNDKDFEGNPLRDKHGNPRMRYFMAVAIEKGDETHWRETPWGRLIWEEAREGFPQFFAKDGTCISPKFAFKVTDGDSTLPDLKSKRPVDREGYMGHWVLNLSTSFKPTSWAKNSNGETVQVLSEHDQFAVRRGYFCGVMATCGANDSLGNPGVYLNCSNVVFHSIGEEIFTGVTATDIDAKFGSTPPAPPAPNPAILNPPPPAPPVVEVAKYEYSGAVYTETQLVAGGWTPQQIATLRKV